MPEDRKGFPRGIASGLGRILVVEDWRIIARDLAATLEDLGYTVVAIAGTGEDAIQNARTLKPDLVLMDIRLPGAIDGIQAAEQIKQTMDIPIIYLTAHSDDETLRRAKSTEPLGYLVKPFRPPELRCAIEIALHKHEIDGRLREREKWLVRTLHCINVGVVATDPNERVEFLNSVAEALTGWTHVEALGMTLDNILELVDGKSRVPIESPLRRSLRQNEATPLQDNAALVARGGAVIPIENSAAPVVDQEGAVIGGVMVFRESTERRAGDKTEALNAELERRVVERTEQLQAANKELEAFSDSVAHDLRAPLRGIDGFSQALIEQHAPNLGQAGLGQLRRIRSAADRMGRLIDDLLRLSQVARRQIERRAVDLSKLARAVAADVHSAAPTRVVEFSVEDGLTVEGDENLLRTVLENLIGNAWKFTSKTESPRIEFGQLEREGPRVCFVRDNGAGFDMRDVQKLFGAFQRLHADSEFEGTGIGLAIVQRIIARHGGRIWAEGAVNKGATVFFTV